MQLALMTEPQLGGTYDDILRIALWCEEQGLTTFARSDHYLAKDKQPHATDAFATLAGLARDTSNVRLAVLVSPISFRHPGVIAKTAATIDEMSGGRMELGIGTGWMELEHDAFGMELWPMRERFERLYDALGYIRAAFGRTPHGWKGRHYSLDEIPVFPVPTGPLPIIVGGSGPRKTPTFAGKFADEYNMFVQTNAGLEARLKVMRDAATEDGRDPDEILVSYVSSVIAGATEHEYRDRLAVAAARFSMEPDALDSRFKERNVPHGTYGAVAEKLAEYSASGIGRFYIQDFDQIGAIDTGYYSELLAAVR